MPSVSPEVRLLELQGKITARDAYELHVLTQVVTMPSDTHEQRQARLLAWQNAMRYAPKEE